MSTPGSGPPRTTLPALLTPVVVILGVLAMGVPLAMTTVAARHGFAVGLRPLRMTAELLLVVPAILALLLFRRPLVRSLALDPVAWISAIRAAIRSSRIGC